MPDEPSGGGSRETDCDEGAALERSGRVKEPEEATESTLAPVTELFRHRFLQVLRDGKHLSAQKITDFLAAAIDHIPPRGHQTIRYYGLYSNKSRGMPRSAAALTDSAGEKQPVAKPPIVPPPLKVTARAMRPLWRDLILRVWGADPLQCPCCKGTMKVVDTFFRSGEIEFFLRLHGLWEWKRSGHRLPQAARRAERQRHQRVIDIPPPPDPPFDIDTFERIEPPWQAIREWIPDDDAEPGGDLFDQHPDSGKPVEIRREDGSILVLDGD